MGLFSFLGGLFGLTSGPSQRIEISKASAASGLPIIYGRNRVTPIRVFKTVSKKHGSLSGNSHDHSFITQTGGEQDKDQKNYDWLHRVDVWGQGEISGIERFWLDGDFATHSRFSARPYFRAASNFGSKSQGAMTSLTGISSRWTAQHKGLGVAYSWSRFFNSSKKPQFDAEPEVKALIKGLKVYDPRLDGTQPGGTGSQRQDDSATWAFSENRALLVLDYLLAEYGFAADPEEIDFPSFMTAADQCDATMTIPARLTNTTGSPVTGYWDRRYGEFVTIAEDAWYPGYREGQTGTSQPRWHAGAVLDPKDGVVKNLRTLLEGFGWALTWSNGRHRLVLEDQTTTPVATYGKDAIMGGWSSTHGMRDGRLNRITIQFRNANKNFEEDTVSWPEKGGATHAAFLAADAGKDLHKTEALDTITDFYRAQAHAEYLVRKSRVGHRIQGLKMAPQALLLEPGDVICLDYPEKGFSGDEDAYYFVEKVVIGAALDVSLDLQKYDDSVYNPDAREQEPLDTSMDTANLWLDPPAVANLAVTSFHESKADGSVVSGLDVSWDEPTDTVGVDRFEIAWREHVGADTEDHSADGPYANSAVLPHDTAGYRIVGLPDGRAYDVRVIYWTQRGQESDVAEQTIDLAAATSKLDGIEEGATRNRHLGLYDDTATYSTGDVVTLDGSSYLFFADTSAVGVDPTEASHWRLLASAGMPVLVEYSAANPPANPQDDSEWHTLFNPVADLYMRQSVGGGGWTQAIRIVGEDGAEGPYTDYRFAHGATAPSVDSGNSNPGAGWQDAPDGGNSDPVWMISARMAADGTLAIGANWSDPVRLTGDAGLNGTDGVLYVGAPESLFGTSPNSYHVRFYGFKDGAPHKTTPATVPMPDGSGMYSFGGASGTSETAQSESTAYMYSAGWDGAWYIILETGGSRPFTHSYSNAQPRHLAVARKENGVWQYHKRGTGWEAFTTSATMLVLGVAERQGGQFVGFTPFTSSLEAAPEIGATAGARSTDLLPVHTVAGGGSTIARTSNGSSTVLSAVDVGATVTITVYDFTLYLGDTEIDYDGGTITGLANATKYFVIAQDATYGGGSVSFDAIAGATYYNALVAGSIMVGSITTPADGGGSSSGGGGSVGEQCVATGMYLGAGCRAGDAVAGTPVLVMDEALDSAAQDAVWSNDTELADCVELISESGCRVICSTTTPMTLDDGTSVQAPDMAGRPIAVVDNGTFRWERCISANPVGRYFVARISVGGRCFAAGTEPDRLVITHNAFKH